MPSLDQIIGTIGGVESSLNPLFGHLTNVKNRKFTREMYGRQRADALADWHMQNEYNSPRAQMQRFQEAGLNPALIYGQMSEAGGVRSSSSSGGQAEAPQVDAMSKLLAGFNVKQAKAQTDNLEEVNKNLQVERDLKRAQIAQIITSTNLTEVQKQKLLFDLGVETDLRDTTIEGRRAAVDRLKVETQSIHSEIIRAWELQPHKVKGMVLDNLQKQKQLAKTDQEIKEIEAKIKLFEQEWKINRMDEKLSDQNFNPKAPALFKWMWNMMQHIFKRFD